MKKVLLRLIDMQILHQLQPQLHKSNIDTQHTHSQIITLFYCQVANLPLSWEIRCRAEPYKSLLCWYSCQCCCWVKEAELFTSRQSQLKFGEIIISTNGCVTLITCIAIIGKLEEPKIAKLLSQIINYALTPVKFLLTNRHSMSSPDDLTVKASCTRLYLNGLYQINQLRLTICVTTLHVFLPPWRISLDKNHAARKQNETINH